jgi:uncharacterized protein (DUF1684 family)
MPPGMSDALNDEILTWRKNRVTRLTAADGWLSLVGKFDLAEGEASVGAEASCDVPLPAGKAAAQLGRFVRRGEQVQFHPESSAPVGVQRARTQVSERVTETITLASDAQGEPDRLVIGSLRIEIMQRGPRFAVRVRDLESDARHQFPGLDYFPIRGDWRIEARFLPADPPRTIELLYDAGSELARCPGTLVFEREGVEYRLDPVFDSNPNRLYLLFGDLTNRTETYGAGRFLYTPLPVDGRVIVDFNQAFNPPCAFTAYATCPLTPPQNRLALRVEAGEKSPHSY